MQHEEHNKYPKEYRQFVFYIFEHNLIMYCPIDNGERRKHSDMTTNKSFRLFRSEKACFSLQAK